MTYKLQRDVTSPNNTDEQPEYGDGWCYLALDTAREECTILSEFGISPIVFEVFAEEENLEIIIMSWD